MNANATLFYVNPATGSMTNPGTAELPWKTFAEVINNNLIATKDSTGKVSAKAVVKAGDTIILMSGYHGDIRIKNGYNDTVITVKAEKNNTPIISSLKLDAGKNWLFKNLVINGSLSDTLQNIDYMVSIGTKDKTSNITLADCYIYSTENAQSWDSEKWKTSVFNGVFLGTHASNIYVTNNYITNINLGINSSAENTTIDGNIVSFFAKDGIRISANDMTVNYNIVTNNVVDDPNHDDAIQGYAEKGIQNIELKGNIILEKTSEPNAFIKPLQGIGFFDGPLNNIRVEDNVIKVSGYHGISLYDGTELIITNNHVMGFNNNKARVAFGTKNKGEVRKNTVLNNTAQAFLLEMDKEVVAENNKTIKLDDDAAFNQQLKDRLAQINGLYGEHHHLAKKARLNLPKL